MRQMQKSMNYSNWIRATLMDNNVLPSIERNSWKWWWYKEHTTTFTLNVSFTFPDTQCESIYLYCNNWCHWREIHRLYWLSNVEAWRFETALTALTFPFVGSKRNLFEFNNLLNKNFNGLQFGSYIEWIEYLKRYEPITAHSLLDDIENKRRRRCNTRITIYQTYRT